MRLNDYHYPHTILISKFLNYFEVDLQEETSELVKSTHEVNNGLLSKMGFTKIGGRWVSKDGEQGGSSSGAHVEYDEEDQEVVEDVDVDAQTEDQPTADMGVGTSAGNQGNRILSMSPFERFMVNRLDNLLKITGIFMIFVLQTFITLTTDFKTWIRVFRPVMNKLKLFKTNFLSCGIGKMIEA